MKRHDWIYPHPRARPAFTTGDPEALAFAHAWVGCGRPLVVTRQVHAGSISLGLALPPGHATRRLACTLDRDAVMRHRGPLAIREVTHILPGDDARALRRFEAALAACGLSAGVYGSTAWACVSGLPYRHDGSDIDVVCDVAASSALEACLAAFASAARELRSRLDGEIRFADGRAVAWRELAQARSASSGVVLARDERGAALLPWRALVAAAP